MCRGDGRCNAIGNEHEPISFYVLRDMYRNRLPYLDTMLQLCEAYEDCGPPVQSAAH